VAVILASESTSMVVAPSANARVAPPTETSLIIAEMANPSDAPSPNVFERAVWLAFRFDEQIAGRVSDRVAGIRRYVVVDRRQRVHAGHGKTQAGG
jgi:hypothetical protein